MSQASAIDITAATPAIILTLTAAVVLVLTVAGGPKQVLSSATHVIVMSCLGATMSAWALVKPRVTFWLADAPLVLDGLAQSMGSIVLLALVLSMLLVMAYGHEHQLAQGEYLALMMLSAAGMLMICAAQDLLLLFLGIEIMSIAAYVLAGFVRSRRRSQEAALKYFIYGAFASAFIVLGLALVWGELGVHTGTASFAYHALGQALANDTFDTLGWVGISLVVSGLVFKTAAAPFHMWAPDVYQGAPTPSVAFFATAIKAAAFAGLARLLAVLGQNAGYHLTTIVQWLEVTALITIGLGNALASVQTQLKRLFAYSSIAHAGYIMLGIAALAAAPNGPSSRAIWVYLLGYTASTVGAFAIIQSLEHKDDRRVDFALGRLDGLLVLAPDKAVALSVFMLGLAGIPPLAGFFGKLSVFHAALSAGRTPGVTAAACLSVLGAYSYLRVIAHALGCAPEGEARHVSSPYLSAVVAMCLTGAVVLGLWPQGPWTVAQALLHNWPS